MPSNIWTRSTEKQADCSAGALLRYYTSISERLNCTNTSLYVWGPGRHVHRMDCEDGRAFRGAHSLSLSRRRRRKTLRKQSHPSSWPGSIVTQLYLLYHTRLFTGLGRRFSAILRHSFSYPLKSCRSPLLLPQGSKQE